MKNVADCAKGNLEVKEDKHELLVLSFGKEGVMREFGESHFSGV